jgi:hypothetical protein
MHHGIFALKRLADRDISKVWYPYPSMIFFWAKDYQLGRWYL